VVDLLLKMGYGGSRADAGQAIGKGGDEGIDGVISEDRLGLDIVYLQAKRWEGSVGRPEIQKLGGSRGDRVCRAHRPEGGADRWTARRGADGGLRGGGDDDSHVSCEAGGFGLL